MQSGKSCDSFHQEPYTVQKHNVNLRGLSGVRVFLNLVQAVVFYLKKVNSFREQSQKCQIEAGAQRGNLSARIINQIHENVQAILLVSFLWIYAPSAVNTRRTGESTHMLQAASRQKRPWGTGWDQGTRSVFNWTQMMHMKAQTCHIKYDLGS